MAQSLWIYFFIDPYRNLNRKHFIRLNRIRDECKSPSLVIGSYPVIIKGGG